ncbi:MAG: CDP-glycerol glycerophosphotransferase family protein [Candidatus Nanopelagicales bacterium]
MGLSVVVACHNVAEFLVACLDSLLAQELPASQVILVNDGSTDDTGRICERYAAANPGWQVVVGPGSGPGGARDLGLDHVTEEYLAFVDGDDVVPPEGFRVLLGTLLKTGSDIASGDVLRYDGAHLLPSGPHRNAILATRLRTTIRSTPALIYDTTSWNKVFRTQFWRDAGLRFPVGVTYEDLSVMIAAHMQARSVDVLKTPVYWWRRRIDSKASITQRRDEIDNLRDRMNAIAEVEAMVGADEFLKRIHDRKVLTFDIPLYTPNYPGADADYQRLFLDLVGAFVRAAAPEVMAELPPRDRLRYWLIEQGKHEELLEFLEFERDPYAVRKTVPGDGVTYADMPFFGDPGIPKELYEWGKAQPVVSQVEKAEWTAEGLAVSGYAYLDGIDSGGPEERRLRIRITGGDEPFWVPVKWHNRADLTAKEMSADVTYANVGLSFTVPFDGLPAEGVLRCDVDVAAPGGRRRVPLAGTYDGAAQLPRRVALPDGRIAAVRWRGESLAIAVYAPRPVVAGVEVPGADRIRVHFDSAEPGIQVAARRRDDFEEVSAPLAGTVELDLSTMPKLESSSQVEFDILLRSAEQEDPAPAILMPETGEVLATFGDREYYARAGITGGLLVTVRSPRPRLLEWKLIRQGLRLRGDKAGSLRALALENRNGVRSDYPLEREGEQWQVVLPIDDAATVDGISHLPAGRWSLLTQDDVPVHVAQHVRERMTEPDWLTVDGVKLGVRSRRSATAYIQIDPAGDIEPPGLHGRKEIISDYYPRRRAKRMRKIILFENWKGKQYSDSLRAIDEQLRRRRDRRRRVWVVRDHGVRMPDGVQTVLRFSPEYYDMLARARWVVSNDSIDPSYVKRDGQIYLQTWHGTPLKKVGQDIEKVNFARKGYLETFADEAAKWDYLVSPNAYSSEIMRRAFGVERGLLETGYPRNDIFYRPEREARAAAARKRIGLSPGQKVILYAPTWRDDRYDDRGRYIFDLKLNMDALRERFGSSHVLLLRGHHLLATRAGIPAEGGFVRNVSTYPDIADLYLIADVLVTDYSSVMFDFANSGRPMLFFTWDLDDYQDRVRGLYFDLTADPPGPICRTSLEVLSAIEQLPDVEQEYAGAYGRFREQFCAWDDGNAAARVIDAALR